MSPEVGTTSVLVWISCGSVRFFWIRFGSDSRSSRKISWTGSRFRRIHSFCAQRTSLPVDMESAGGKYLAAIKNLSPEHMLVLQMLTALRRTANTDCVAFVQHFTTKNENKLYNLPDFLTSLRTFIQNLAAQNVGNAKGSGATVNAITRAVNKTCAVKNCTLRVVFP